VYFSDNGPNRPRGGKKRKGGEKCGRRKKEEVSFNFLPGTGRRAAEPSTWTKEKEGRGPGRHLSTCFSPARKRGKFPPRPKKKREGKKVAPAPAVSPLLDREMGKGKGHGFDFCFYDTPKKGRKRGAPRRAFLFFSSGKGKGKEESGKRAVCLPRGSGKKKKERNSRSHPGRKKGKKKREGPGKGTRRSSNYIKPKGKRGRWERRHPLLCPNPRCGGREGSQ